jgi:hypothetical protein
VNTVRSVAPLDWYHHALADPAGVCSMAEFPVHATVTAAVTHQSGTIVADHPRFAVIGPSPPTLSSSFTQAGARTMSLDSDPNEPDAVHDCPIAGVLAERVVHRFRSQEDEADAP